MPFNNWGQQQDPQMGQFPALPPPPDPRTFPLSRGPNYTKKFIQETEEYLAWEMKVSAEYMRRKLDRWKLLEGLYGNTRRLSDWHKSASALVSDPTIVSNKRWQSDFIISAAPVIQSFVDRIYNALFKSKDYFLVEADPIPGNKEDPAFPTSKKMQAHLLKKNKEAFFKTQIYAILTDHALYGTCLAKCFWYRKEFRRWRIAPDGQEILVPESREFPLIEAVPLDMAIIDPGARHSDCQRWRYVGHRTFVPIELIRARFNDGTYNINRDVFERRWKSGGGVSSTGMTFDRTYDLWRDPFLRTLTDYGPQKNLCVWELHAEVPTGQEETFEEVISTFITDRPDDEPTMGTMVRLNPGPALPWGMRPLMAAHFTPLASPFGQSAIEPHLDLLYYLSHMTNIVLDNARLQTNVMLKAKNGSRIQREIDKMKGKDSIYPGKVFYWDDNPNEIMPMEPLQLPSAAMQSLIQYFQHQWEQRSKVSDTTLGMSQRDKTATEAYQLGQMADIPFAARLDLFSENLFEVYGNHALSMIQNNTLEPQEVRVQSSMDMETRALLSMPEIKTGKYIVKAALTYADQQRVAKFQSMERLTPSLIQAQPALAAEGTVLSVTNWLRIMLEMEELGDRADQVLIRMSPPEVQALNMLKQLPPQALQQVLGVIQQMLMGPQDGGPNGPGGPQGPGGGPQGGGAPGPGGQQGPPRQPTPMGMRGNPMGTQDRSDQGTFAQMLQLMSGANGGTVIQP